MNNNFWDLALGPSTPTATKVIQNLRPWNAVTNQPQSPQIFTEAVTTEVLQGAERVDNSIAPAKSLSEHVANQISNEEIMASSGSSDQANIPGEDSSKKNASLDHREMLAGLLDKGMDKSTIGLLMKEGFTSPKMLRYLNTDAVEKLFAKCEGEESLPLAQTMILRELAATNDKPSPARVHLSSQSHQSGKADLPFTQQSLASDTQQDVWPSTQQIQRLQHAATETTLHGDLTAPTLSQILGTTPVHPPAPHAVTNTGGMRKADADNLMLRRGKHVNYHDIADFVPSFLKERERTEVAANKSGAFYFEAGPSRIPLNKISVEQWGMANARIMCCLIEEGKLLGREVEKYLEYTVRVNQLFTRFQLESVLMYDREFRVMQAKEGSSWGEESQHLANIYLVDLRFGNNAFGGNNRNNSGRNNNRNGQFSNHSGGQNHGGFRNNNGNGGAGNQGNQNRKPNPVDPKTGKQVCLAWNNTQCGYANCKFTHVCMICYEAHPRFKHENESASKNVGQH